MGVRSRPQLLLLIAIFILPPWRVELLQEERL